MHYRHLFLSVAVGILSALLLLPAQGLAAFTYYVDAANGNDSNTPQQAKNPATPWKTIKTAALTAVAGDTILVQPGTYTESVESKRDGSTSSPITFKANGAVTVRPPAGSPGFFVSHDHIIIDGFTVTGGTLGLRLGPHDGGDGPVAGLIARNNVVTGNSSNGIQFSNAVDGIIEFNTASQNGQNGISYSGNSSQIHDNTANSNGQFGIYVKDGIDHQVWNNSASGNTKGNIKIQGVTIPPPGSAPVGQRTFYIDGATGDDARTELQAQSAATPWKTIARGLQSAVAGETVAILPGVYAVSVESKKDGTADAAITIRAKTPGTVTIQPPSGSGFYLAHNYNVIDGVNVVGGTTGIQMGPYKNTNGTVTGLVARNVLVMNANGAGIKFANAVDGVVMHSIIRDSGKDGIYYGGSGANLFNNLLFGNGRNLTGEYAITLASGNNHQVVNNTVYGNKNGGIRLGTSNNTPVFSTVLNNIVVQNPIGVREPAGSNYTGRATLDYNDVYNNPTNYSLSAGSGTVKGPNSLNVAPAFVDPANNDFRLGRQASGQATDSPVINKGSDTAENLGLSGRSPFTDKLSDTGQVDLGYHGTPLVFAEGVTTIGQATLMFNPSGQNFSLAANLRPGLDGDGIETGTEFVQISFGGYQYLLPIGNFTQAGSVWTYNGGGGISAASLEELGDGSVNVTLQVNGLALQATISTSIGISVQVGDDFASSLVSFQGTLQYP
jgi:parallel beta-helix repeat protein